MVRFAPRRNSRRHDGSRSLGVPPYFPGSQVPFRQVPVPVKCIFAKPCATCTTIMPNPRGRRRPEGRSPIVAKGRSILQIRQGGAILTARYRASRVCRQVDHEQPQIPDSESFRADPSQQASVPPSWRSNARLRGAVQIPRDIRGARRSGGRLVIDLGLTSIPPNSRAGTADLTR